jgi:hypothetical protein
VGQNYYIDERNSLISFGASTPMNKGDRWIYFLTNIENAENSDEYFNQFQDFDPAEYPEIFFNHLWTYGRHPIPDKEILRAMDEFALEKSRMDEWIRGLQSRMEPWEGDGELLSKEFVALEEDFVISDDDVYVVSPDGDKYVISGDDSYVISDGNVYLILADDVYLTLDGNDYILSGEDSIVFGEFSARLNKITDVIDSSALGVLHRDEFNFAIYSEVLEYFQIEAQDWVNPGRSYDARLIELAN